MRTPAGCLAGGRIRIRQETPQVNTPETRQVHWPKRGPCDSMPSLLGKSAIAHCEEDPMLKRPLELVHLQPTFSCIPHTVYILSRR